MKINIPNSTRSRNETEQHTDQIAGSVDAMSTPSFPTMDEMLGDIERLICHIASPYVDHSNPMLHLDELCAECRYKLAKIIDAGYMECCGSRAKFFGFLKVSFRNHIRTLVQKHAFCWKRTGIRPESHDSVDHEVSEGQTRQKPLHLSLDDNELGLQLGAMDCSNKVEELIDNIAPALSEEEEDLLRRILQSDHNLPKICWSEGPGISENTTRYQARRLRRYAASLGLGADEFVLTWQGILSKRSEINR